jgi:hypothetical protein
MKEDADLWERDADFRNGVMANGKHSGDSGSSGKRGSVMPSGACMC